MGQCNGCGSARNGVMFNSHLGSGAGRFLSVCVPQPKVPYNIVYNENSYNTQESFQTHLGKSQKISL